MESQLNQDVQNEDKTVAILSYVTLLGWIIALVMHGSNKTKLGAFHLRQMLGLIIIGVGLSVVYVILAFIPILGILINLALFVSFIACWIIGLVAAANGEMKPLPVIGEPIQNILKDFAK